MYRNPEMTCVLVFLYVSLSHDGHNIPISTFVFLESNTKSNKTITWLNSCTTRVSKWWKDVITSNSFRKNSKSKVAFHQFAMFFLFFCIIKKSLSGFMFSLNHRNVEINCNFLKKNATCGTSCGIINIQSIRYYRWDYFLCPSILSVVSSVSDSLQQWWRHRWLCSHRDSRRDWWFSSLKTSCCCQSTTSAWI